jgi:hypothetical protein
MTKKKILKRIKKKEQKKKTKQKKTNDIKIVLRCFVTEACFTHEFNLFGLVTCKHNVLQVVSWGGQEIEREKIRLLMLHLALAQSVKEC